MPSPSVNRKRFLVGAAVFLLGGLAAWQVGLGAPALLGVVEGITEFLPVSSTGHLLITSWLIHFKGSLEGTFEIFIQLGAVVAVLLFYRRDLLGQARALLGANAGGPAATTGARRLWLAVLLAFLPAAVFGLALHKTIKRHLFIPPVISFTLTIGGVVLLLVEKVRRAEPRTRDLAETTPRQALLIGLAQVLALVPGVSRSGASIVGGMLVGMDRITATAFSFYLALPTLGGATVVDLAKSLSLVGPDDAIRLLVGTVVSFAVSFVCIGWLLRYVSRNSFTSFGWYRIVAGLALLGLWVERGRGF
jgi:undecaprenyl-diphosphatase